MKTLSAIVGAADVFQLFGSSQPVPVVPVQ